MLAPMKDEDSDDGEPCTAFDTCADGNCLPGVATECNDGNACTNDFCLPGTGCQRVIQS